MRIALLLVLLLGAASLAHAQHAVPLVEPRPQVAERPLSPAADEVVPATVREVRETPQERAAALQERPSRAVWFLVGALTVAAIMLAVLL